MCWRTHAITSSKVRPYVQPQPAPSCGQLLEADKNAEGLQLYLTDRLRLDVKVSHGNEVGSWAGASQFDSRSIFELVGPGPFGTGTLGTFLTDIFTEGSASFEYDGEQSAGRGEAYEYRFRVPRGASHYSVEVGRDWHVVGYEGVLRVDPQSFDLRYLLVKVTAFPPESETCEAVTNVDYDRVQIGTGNFLLPLRSRLRILMTVSTESDITTTYARCREYHGEATIHFGDEPPAIVKVQKEDNKAPVILPVGLPVSLALAATIDTENCGSRRRFDGEGPQSRARQSVRRGSHPGGSDGAGPDR